MAHYQILEWEYINQEDIDKAVEWFKNNRRLVILNDEQNDKSFIIVGDSTNKELDMKQAAYLQNIVNSEEFQNL